MATFQARLREQLGPRGYETGMRRSVQSVVLFEAHRCVADRLPTLRPFQRKMAFWDQALALVQTLDFMLPHQREEIMWRTGTSKELLTADTSWKRMKLIEKEVEKIIERIKPFWPGNTHHEACEQFVQQQYKGKQHASNWEHAHNNVFLTYRMYYRQDVLDPTFPAPTLPKDIVVPAEKPKPGSQTTFVSVNTGQRVDSDDLDIAALVGAGPDPEERRNVLKEVREHLDLLKEFEGIIGEEELAKRKKDLYMALPSAPPPVPVRGNKRARTSDASE